MQGCGISSAKEGGTMVFLLLPVTPQIRFPKFFTHKNPFSLHDPVQACCIFIANALEISQCGALSPTTWQNWWCHSVVISPLKTTWDTAVFFAHRHHYIRTGVSTILMIWFKYAINWTQRIWDHGQNWYRCCSIWKSFCRIIK